MKNTILLLVTTCAISSGVTTSFSAFGSGNQTVLANSTGVAANGLIWGILVDTANDGFDDLSVAGLATTNLASDTFVAGTDDFFIAGDSATITFAGATGVASSLSYTLGADVAGGENYGLFWSDDASLEAGDSYGFLQAAADVPGTVGDTIPTSDANNDPTSQFRSANALEQEETFSQAVVQPPMVPEPTSGALLGLAGIALVARRKR